MVNPCTGVLNRFLLVTSQRGLSRMKIVSMPFLIIYIPLLMIGCSFTSTKPNTSAIYRVPAIYDQLPPISAESKQQTLQPLPDETQALFQRLYTLDPALAIEVGKLPELQGAIDEKTILCFKRFTDLVGNASSTEKARLMELLNEGKPDFRSYCGPLQAVFWLQEDDYNPLQYPIETIVRQAWDFTDQNRWSDYEMVTERLNSPLLLSIYEKWNFRYKSKRGTNPKRGSAKRIFSIKSGNCQDYTAFSVFCLKRAGYEAKAIKMVSPSGGKFHIVCEYKDKDGQVYIMDVDCMSCTDGQGIVKKEVYIKRLPQIGYGYH